MKRTALAASILFLLVSGTVHAFCFEQAGREFGVSPQLLWAIAKKESCLNPTAVNRNANGSYDYGVMQINSSWYKILGDQKWRKLSDPCYNVRVGAWVLSQCIKKYGYTWEAVGCYNSSKQNARVKYASEIHRELVKAGLTTQGRSASSLRLP